MLQSDDLFGDIGANVGSYTILASAVCGTHTIAVEPDPRSMNSLMRNIEINRLICCVETVQAALGASEGVARFTVGLDTMNHIAKGRDKAFQEVKLHTLDHIVGGRVPALIKMDVEGFEADVVAVGLATLANSSLLAIITESAGAQVRDPIEAAGFRICAYEPFSRELSAKEDRSSPHSNNFLFIRDIDAVRRRIAAAPKRLIAEVTL